MPGKEKKEWARAGSHVADQNENEGHYLYSR